MKKMIRNITVLSLTFGASFAPSGMVFAADNDLTICHTANVGYSVSDGKRMVLIDSIYRDIYPGDQEMPMDLLEKITTAQPPYNLPTNVLVTHFHEDHFEAGDVIKYLTNNKNAHALMTPEAREKIVALTPPQDILDRADAILPKPNEGLTHNAVGQVKGAEQTIEAYYLDHGNPAKNVGYYFEMGGKSFYHLGDLNQSGADLEKVGYKGPDLKGGKIDYLFVPFWYFIYEVGPQTLADYFPAHNIIPTHLPTAEPQKKYFANYGGHQGMIDHVIGSSPNNILLAGTETCLANK